MENRQLRRNAEFGHVTHVASNYWHKHCVRNQSQLNLLSLVQPKTPQACCKLLILPALLQLVNNLLQTWEKNQLAASLWTSCIRFVFNKLLQAMRTHPDIGLWSSLLQDVNRLAATCAFLAIRSSTLLTRTFYLKFLTSYEKYFYAIKAEIFHWDWSTILGFPCAGNKW